MSVQLPAHGTMPTDSKAKDYEEKMLEYKETEAKRNFAIQTMSEMQSQQTAMQSNLSKANDEALKAIINNFKG